MLRERVGGTTSKALVANGNLLRVEPRSYVLAVVEPAVVSPQTKTFTSDPLFSRGDNGPRKWVIQWRHGVTRFDLRFRPSFLMMRWSLSFLVVLAFWGVATSSPDRIAACRAEFSRAFDRQDWPTLQRGYAPQNSFFSARDEVRE